MQKSNKVISLEIKNAIRRSSRSLEELSKKIGVDTSQLCRFANCKFKKHSKNLVKVCSFFSISLISNNREDSELQKAVLAVWDGTEKHKQQIMKLLSIAEEFTN